MFYNSIIIIIIIIIIIQNKYKELLRQQKQYFNDVKFVNISLSCLGVFAKESDTFLKMLDNVGFSKAHKKYCVKKNDENCYQNFLLYLCYRNKDWENPKIFTLSNTFLIFTYLHVSLFFNV